MKYKKIITFILIALIITPYNVIHASSEVSSSCDAIFTDTGLTLVRQILSWVRIIAPAIVVVLIGVDFATAVVNHNQEALTEAGKKVLKRGLALIGLFMVPTFVITLSKFTPVSATFASDPLCEKATGTKATSALRDLRTNTNIQIGGTPNIVGNSSGSHTPGVGGGSYNEGPGGDHYSKTVTINGRTFKVYKQATYPDVKFWHGSIATAGCGPSALAIALSGYMDVTPIQTAHVMEYGGFARMEKILGSFGASGGRVFYNSNDRNEKRIADTVAKIRAHLKSGKPAVALVSAGIRGCPEPNRYAVANHFIALLGETADGQLIVGNSGGLGDQGTLEDLVRYYFPGGGKGALLINI